MTHEAANSPWPFFAPIGLFLVLFGLALGVPVVALGGVVGLIIAAGGWFVDANREWRDLESSAALAVGGSQPILAAVGGEEEGPWTRFRPVLGLYLALGLTVALAAWIPALPTTAAAAAGGDARAGGTATVASGTVDITASNLKFSVATIEAPAGTPFHIAFTNSDSLPHNLAIYDSKQLAKMLFRGDVVQGPSSADYAVPALPAGTYWFQCDVHPGAMFGTLVVK
ncbi:MAG TPA: cupredoxin domain-containing protein [Candidatus Limnocylindrales bacterium]|jgi:plastocyanin|nr:cupredoxin domain-containing protein [Candidatus Limnocylindrales bacterium]